MSAGALILTSNEERSHAGALAPDCKRDALPAFADASGWSLACCSLEWRLAGGQTEKPLSPPPAFADFGAASGEREMIFWARLPRVALVPRLPWAIIRSSRRDFSLARYARVETNDSLTRAARVSCNLEPKGHGGVECSDQAR